MNYVIAITFKDEGMSPVILDTRTADIGSARIIKEAVCASLDYNDPARPIAKVSIEVPRDLNDVVRGATYKKMLEDVRENERPTSYDDDEDYISEMGVELNDCEFRAQIMRNHDVADEVADCERLTWKNCPVCGSSDDTVWDEQAQEWKRR